MNYVKLGKGFSHDLETGTVRIYRVDDDKAVVIIAAEDAVRGGIKPGDKLSVLFDVDRLRILIKQDDSGVVCRAYPIMEDIILEFDTDGGILSISDDAEVWECDVVGYSKRRGLVVDIQCESMIETPKTFVRVGRIRPKEPSNDDTARISLAHKETLLMSTISVSDERKDVGRSGKMIKIKIGMDASRAARFESGDYVLADLSHDLKKIIMRRSVNTSSSKGGGVFKLGQAGATGMKIAMKSTTIFNVNLDRLNAVFFDETEVMADGSIVMTLPECISTQLKREW